MAIVYEKMIKIFKERGITSYTFRNNHVISQRTWTNIQTGKGLDTKSLNALCKYLDCQPGDLLEYVPDEEEN